MPTYLEPIGVPQWAQGERPRREQFNKAFEDLNKAYAGINTDALTRAESAAASAVQNAESSADSAREAREIAAATELQFQVDGDRFGLKRPADTEFEWTDHLTGPVGPTGKPLRIAGRFNIVDELTAAYPDGDGDNSYLVGQRIYIYAGGIWQETDIGGAAGTVNNQSPDAKGNIELTAEHIPVEVAGMDAGTVQEAVRILKKDGDEVREYFTPEGAVKNANALNGIPGKNYLPEKITDLTGAKSYEYAAPKACVARPSFIGRTVQEGTPEPDSPAPIRGVLNPWIAAYSGGPVEIPAGVEPLMALPDGTADRIVLRDGVWGIERVYKWVGFTGGEPWIAETTNDPQQTVGFHINLSDAQGTPNGNIAPIAICNSFKAYSPNQNYGLRDISFSINHIKDCWFKLPEIGTLDAWKLFLSEKKATGNSIKMCYKLEAPVFEPVPAWNGLGKIEPIAVTTTIAKPDPDAPISPDNVATITGTSAVATGYRGMVKQLTGELFDGDSFDGVNLTANGTVSRHNLDLALSPGAYTIEAGDENGLLESTSIDILPNSAVYGRRVYPYQHMKEGTVHKLTGTPGAEQIIFRTTGAYQDGDTWTLNGAAVAVTYNDGKKLLPTAVIAGSVVEAAIEGNTVRLMLQKPASQLSFNPTIYVDAANGNDTTGDGSEAKPYATITKALYSLPKNLGGNQAIIKVADGTYDGFWIVNYFNGSLQINAVTPENGRVKITSEIVCLGCICGIYFNGLTSVSTANSCFNAQSSQEMSIVNCWATEPAPDTIGIQAAYGSRIMVNTVEISNKKIGANIDYAASLSSHMLTGSGNGIGVNCFSAIVYTSGSITGTTHRQVNYGQIFG